MTKRSTQHELPNTRRPDEGPPPEPFKAIKALDDTCAEYVRLLNRQAKLRQEIVANKQQQQQLLVKHDRSTYPYDHNGKEHELVRVEQVKSRKTKTKPDAEVGKGKRGRKAAESEPAESDES